MEFQQSHKPHRNGPAEIKHYSFHLLLDQDTGGYFQTVSRMQFTQWMQMMYSLFHLGCYN